MDVDVISNILREILGIEMNLRESLESLRKNHGADQPMPRCGQWESKQTLVPSSAQSMPAR